MPQNPSTILAVNPSTKYLAIAVFHGNQLKDWRMKVLKGKWSEEKLQKAIAIITSLIDKHVPDTLCLKRLHRRRSSPALDSLSAQIEKLALTEHLWFYRYSIKELEAFLCAERTQNKKNLAEAVAGQFPELYRELDIEKSRKNPYHMRVFEAVALGIVCARNQCDNKDLTRQPGAIGSQAPTSI